jgi:hypothetical protein
MTAVLGGVVGTLDLQLGGRRLQIVTERRGPQGGEGQGSHDTDDADDDRHHPDQQDGGDVGQEGGPGLGDAGGLVGDRGGQGEGFVLGGT